MMDELLQEQTEFEEILIHSKLLTPFRKDVSRVFLGRQVHTLATMLGAEQKNF